MENYVSVHDLGKTVIWILITDGYSDVPVVHASGHRV